MIQNSPYKRGSIEPGGFSLRGTGSPSCLWRPRLCRRASDSWSCRGRWWKTATTAGTSCTRSKADVEEYW